MSLTIQLPSTTEHYLRKSASREGMPLEHYISQLLTATSLSTVIEKKKKPLTERELLRLCELDVQADDLQEYHRLRGLFEVQKMTDAEQAALIQLNDLIEIAHAKRMAYVLQLAQLRHISLEKMMVDLGIKHLSA